MNDAAPNYRAGFLAAVGANGNPVQPVPAHTPAGRIDRPPAAVPVPSRPELSFEERVKRELHPLDAFPRLLASAHHNQPPDAGDRFRFQWFGLFYQGPQQDAFLLRVRLPGGRLSAFQLAGLAEITQELAAGGVIYNGQGGLDIPGVPVRGAAEILRRMEEIGLRTLLSGGDCVQAVRGGEREGLTPAARPPLIYPLVRELEQALALNRRLSDLPHRCEVVLRAADEAPAPTENGPPAAETIVFQAAADLIGREPAMEAGEPAGFTISVPGAGALGLTLSAAQIVPACLEILGRWATQGDRSDRRQAGLARFCVEEGVERLRTALAPVVGRLPAASWKMPGAAAAALALSTGVPVQGGRLLSGVLTRLAEAAQAYGTGEIRLAAGHLYLPQPTDADAAERALRHAVFQP